MRWNFQSTNIPQNIKQLKEILLSTLEIQDPDVFFAPPHPLDLSLAEVGLDSKQMAHAVQLLIEAKDKQQDVLIFGDYDADGISATAILWRVLHQAGLKVRPFIPDRLKNGYGITAKTLEEIFHQQKPDLIVTVDNGIVAHEAADFAKAEGVPMIITDHHTSEAELPVAVAIVHSTQLCGATVAWMVGREFLKTDQPGQEQLMNLELDLAGLATIADQVPLQAANRAFAYHGLKALKTSKRPGFLALLKLAQFAQKQIDEYAVNFVLAPRVNAMGRLEHGLDALRLLCTRQPAQAQELASLLDQTNQTRKDLTLDAIASAQTDRQKWQAESLIITASPEYHEGVIGLIAGRLTERYHKPSIAIALGDRTSKASARSIEGVNITQLIRKIKSDLLSAGGHPLAAGFSFETEKLDLISEKLLALAKESIDPELLEPQLDIACQISDKLFIPETVTLIDEFAPFGSQNPKPLLALSNLQLLEAQTMGQENKHLRLKLQNQNQDLLVTAVGWNKGYLAPDLKPGQQLNLAGTIELNHWKNKTYLQFKIRDLQVLE